MKKSKYIDIDRLCCSMHHSRLSLRKPREVRREIIREYLGKHYSEDAAVHQVPVNMLAMWLSIVSRNLIPKSPRVLISTFDPSIKPMIAAMKDWANYEMDHMNLANTMTRVVIDALIGVGCCKVALGTPAESARFNWGLTAGTAFCDRVDFDDLVYDVHARDFSEVSYVGHRFRLPREAAIDAKLYATKAIKDLPPSNDRSTNAEGDERASVISRGYYGSNSEEFEDFVDLWEVYLPRHDVVLTLADDWVSGATGYGAGAAVEPLAEKRWLGPPQGPYHFLSYNIVPSNAMPKGPALDLYDMHRFINSLARKLMDQAMRQKSVTFVAGGADSDGNRLIDTPDGEAIKVDNPDKIRETSWGGPDAKNFQIFAAFRDLFKEHAGNLDMLGGLGPQSKTLGQDRILAESASRTVADNQKATIDYLSKVCNALCWFWYHDPQMTMRSNFSLPGLPDKQIIRKVTPKDRMKGRYEDLRFTIDPYSLQGTSPQGRLSQLMSVMQQVVLPAGQLLQSQGIVIDMNAYLKKVAEYGDMPDLQEIITIQEPPQEAQVGGRKEGMMPSQTERSYTRQSVAQQETMPSKMENATAAMMSAEGGEAA